MSTPHKNESPVIAGQFAKSIKSNATDFIATTARYATVRNGINILSLVLALQFVLIVWGTL